MKLIGSTKTIEQLKVLTSDWFGGSTVIFTEINSTTWNVSTGKGPIEGLIVRLVKSRYRLEMIKG